MKVYAVLRKILRRLFIGMFRVEVEGMENIPKEGALIVCPNHISNWDPVLLGAVMDRQVRFMAKSSLFKIPLLSSLIKCLGAFPVHRGAADPTAIKTAIGHLKNGDAVGVFPQGTRCMGKEPKDTEVKNGLGMIAYRAKADVLPVSIKTKNYKMRMFRKVYITVGQPIPYSELGFEQGNQAEYTKATEYAFGKVLELL